MAWFRIDDDWIDHPKARRAGRDGRDLWVAAGNKCAKYSTDGYVEGILVPDYAALAGISRHKAAAKALVVSGLWHDQATLAECRKCCEHLTELNKQRTEDGEPVLELGPDDYFFHEWWPRQQPKKARQSIAMKDREDRARALRRNTDLCREIQRRDQGYCRYCLIKVNWNDRKSRSAATYDHVDPECFEPDGGNYLDGVVTACKRCNSRKRDLTPAEAGMTIKPVPDRPTGHPDDAGQDLTGSNPNQNQIKSGSDSEPKKSNPDLTSRGRNAQDGPGLIGLDPGLDSGLDPGRAEAGRAGPGGADPGRDGLGGAEGREPPPGGPADPPPDLTDSDPFSTEDPNS